MATEKEKELAKQILAKLTEMDTKLARIEDSIGELNDKETSTSVEGKLDDVKSINKGIQATFEQGFADVHKGLAEIKEVKQIKKNGKQVH
ncbi:chromosome segregation protein SMC [Bacillus cereus]|uniref:chromosome segregation protein SMC n=1 Tax=Bacillus cereus TaxID=1396 RepID=UPI00298CC193|nr:chromosome segregation protein SMC [Bacillus cereus]WPA86311.1 chromosome segregation protein SMC [Bacillus cereus]